ncbi:MAG TPA: hypothetical protein VNW92_30335, partial [Polyangiaceae bacterium]|nr:hypothetical protein [Polyangiaceae bacterium]
RRRSWIHWLGITALPALASLALLGVFTRRGDGTALAQPGPPQAPTAQCSLRGQSVMPVNAAIVDLRGNAIARFSGAPTPLVASDFPSDAQGKVRIETGFGAGSFRIRGFVDPAQLPLFAVTNVTVTPGHVWIASNHAVTLIGAASGRLRVEKKLSAPLLQTFRGAGECSAFSLEPGTPAGFAPAGDARGYALKREALDLYADAAAEVPVTTLHRAPSVDAVLFFSSEQRGSFVHLEYHGDVLIDGWAKANALSALPAGETMDQLVPATSPRSTSQMTFQTQPKLLRPSRDVALRRAAKEAEPTIGVIEPGAETYVIDQVAGWASVLPKSMNVLPPADGQFWAKSSDLGL